MKKDIHANNLILTNKELSRLESTIRARLETVHDYFLENDEYGDDYKIEFDTLDAIHKKIIMLLNT